MLTVQVEPATGKKQVLKLEVAVLRKLQDSPHAAKFVHCGRQQDYNYLVMEHLGQNLNELRRKMPNGVFSLGTTARLGRQLLRAIKVGVLTLQHVHSVGYLHRDVKPSNFVLGDRLENSEIVYVIDFGLARRFRNLDGSVRPPRDVAGFRGTARYASVASHQGRDLGRRDDLISLFYILVEFMTGGLAWRKLKEKDEICAMKIAINHKLCDDLPPEMKEFQNFTTSLSYSASPDYDYLDGLLKKILARHNAEKEDRGASESVDQSSPNIQRRVLERTITKIPQSPQPSPKPYVKELEKSTALSSPTLTPRKLDNDELIRGPSSPASLAQIGRRLSDHHPEPQSPLIPRSTPPESNHPSRAGSRAWSLSGGSNNADGGSVAPSILPPPALLVEGRKHEHSPPSFLESRQTPPQFTRRSRSQTNPLPLLNHRVRSSSSPVPQKDHVPPPPPAAVTRPSDFLDANQPAMNMETRSRDSLQVPTGVAGGGSTVSLALTSQGSAIWSQRSATTATTRGMPGNTATMGDMASAQDISAMSVSMVFHNDPDPTDNGGGSHLDVDRFLRVRRQRSSFLAQDAMSNPDSGTRSVSSIGADRYPLRVEPIPIGGVQSSPRTPSRQSSDSIFVPALQVNRRNSASGEPSPPRTSSSRRNNKVGPAPIPSLVSEPAGSSKSLKPAIVEAPPPKNSCCTIL